MSALATEDVSMVDIAVNVGDETGYRGQGNLCLRPRFLCRRQAANQTSNYIATPNTIGRIYNWTWQCIPCLMNSKHSG